MAKKENIEVSRSDDRSNVLLSKIAQSLMVLILTSLLFGCGPAFLPERTTKPVTPGDVVGRWRYTVSSTTIKMEFLTSGDFTQTIPLATGGTKVQKGTWRLTGPDLELTNIILGIGSGTLSVANTDWYMIDNTRSGTPQLLIFGGDDLDPDSFVEFVKLP